MGLVTKWSISKGGYEKTTINPENRYDCITRIRNAENQQTFHPTIEYFALRIPAIVDVIEFIRSIWRLISTDDIKYHKIIPPILVK